MFTYPIIPNIITVIIANKKKSKSLNSIILFGLTVLIGDFLKTLAKLIVVTKSPAPNIDPTVKFTLFPFPATIAVMISFAPFPIANKVTPARVCDILIFLDINVTVGDRYSSAV